MLRAKRALADYGTIILALSFVSNGMAFLVWHSFPVFFVALVEDFGSSRAEVAGAFSLFAITYGLASPLMGRVVNGVGARRMMPVGGLVAGMALVATSTIHSLWMLYLLFGIVCALGVNVLGPISTYPTISNWFLKGRGTALGIASAGSGILWFVMVPILQRIISAGGWRLAYLVLALLIGLVLPPVVYAFYRDRPREIGIRRDLGEGKGSRADPPFATGEQMGTRPLSGGEWTAHGAISSHRFWFVFFGIFLAFFATVMVSTHQVAYLVDAGFDKLLAATAFGFVGLLSSLAKVMWGSISDRIGREWTVTIGALVFEAAILALLAIKSPSHLALLYLTILLTGIGHGVFGPLTISIAADIFQGRNFPSIYGILAVGDGAGSALGSWLAGLLYDWRHNYIGAFLVAFIALALSCLCLWLAAPRRARVYATD